MRTTDITKFHMCLFSNMLYFKVINETECHRENPKGAIINPTWFTELTAAYAGHKDKIKG